MRSVECRQHIDIVNDLRKKQWRLWTQGESREVVAKRFKIGETTLYEWQVRKKETGDFASKKPGSVGYNHKITDWNAFAEFAKKHDSIGNS